MGIQGASASELLRLAVLEFNTVGQIDPVQLPDQTRGAALRILLREPLLFLFLTRENLLDTLQKDSLSQRVSYRFSSEKVNTPNPTFF